MNTTKKAPRRPPPYYLLTGLLVGLLTGLALTLVFRPVYVDTAPGALSDADKSAYRSLAAMAFAVDHDLGRAQARLALLKDKNSPMAVAAQAQQELSQNGPESSTVKGLSLLATAFAPTAAAIQPVSTPEPGGSQTPTLTGQPDLMLTPSATLDPNAAVMTATASASPTPTERALTPLATFTPRVTSTPLPSLGYPFILTDKSDVCDPRLPGLLQLEVNDKAGNPVPGVRISVAWDGGEDQFFTGLHPNINPGYADFSMTPAALYAVKVGDISKPVEKIGTSKCKGTDGTPFPGGLMLQFGQK